ncbi:MAG: UDP-N-acetylmuramate--L-alanine ligase [Clostridia bacterium]
MKDDINRAKNVHFIGIGGCSMSGLAEILYNRGCIVTGSDSSVSPFTEKLVDEGISVKIGQSANNIPENCELIVYSAAISEDNPERVEARRRNIEEIERCDALGGITAGYKNVVGISGCHGKTTITSMLALIAEYGGFDATVHIGGFVERLKGGVRLGSHDLFITEACEYVESFLSLNPTVVLINNIDDDHLNYYKNINNIVAAFKKFVSLLPRDGILIACTDDFRVKKIYREFRGKKFSYGLRDAEIIPCSVMYDENGYPSFDLCKDGDVLGRISLNVIGEFNMLNAVAAAAVAITLGADIKTIARALYDFQSTRRRFEYYGERNGVKVFHDYAHHPGEIRAVLRGAMRYPHKRLFVVFQCNSYSRAKTLFINKVDCFSDADIVLVPDIYPGREAFDSTVHARDMVQAIAESGVKAEYLETFEKINEYLLKNTSPGDIVVTLGSGDVYKQSRIFTK